MTLTTAPVAAPLRPVGPSSLLMDPDETLTAARFMGNVRDRLDSSRLRDSLDGIVSTAQNHASRANADIAAYEAGSGNQSYHQRRLTSHAYGMMDHIYQYLVALSGCLPNMDIFAVSNGHGLGGREAIVLHQQLRRLEDTARMVTERIVPYAHTPLNFRVAADDIHTQRAHWYRPDELNDVSFHDYFAQARATVRKAVCTELPGSSTSESCTLLRYLEHRGPDYQNLRKVVNLLMDARF